MMKIFISQPMNNRTNEEIIQEREIIIEKVKEYLKVDRILVIDSFFKNAPHDAKPLWFLGESIKLMSEADYVVFAPYFFLARGCNIEYDCAKQYGKQVLEPKDYWT